MEMLQSESSTLRRKPAPGSGPGRQPRPAEPLPVFQRERSMLLAIASRIVGSAREAEDVVQEAFIRWQKVDHRSIQNPPAFLTRMVTRLSINAVKAAHRRRMEYVGVFLPDPDLSSVDDACGNPLEMQEVAEDLTAAFSIMLERLTPVERAVFLLHECFGYSYAEISTIVGKTEENCRQIERRAWQRLVRRGHLHPADREESAQLFGLFLRASRDGEMDPFLGVLAKGATEYAAGKKMSSQQMTKHKMDGSAVPLNPGGAS